MFYITGDTHAHFDHIEEFCYENHTTRDDVMIILGDAGLNYFGDYRDTALKEFIVQLPITLLCIHGNHERRPETINGYDLQIKYGGLVYFEPHFDNILFAKDGEIYNFNGMQAVVIGGAYSVDKYYRIARGWHWFEDEQPDAIKMREVEQALDQVGWKVDYVLTHTCPFKYLPTEVFLPGIDQSKVDQQTEKWLDHINDKLTYNKWYCGHYHTSKKIDHLQFMFHDIEELTCLDLPAEL